MTTLIEIKDLSELVSAIAGSLGKFADSIARVATLSVQGYDFVRARRDRDRLKELYRKLGNFHRKQGIAIRNLAELTTVIAMRPDTSVRRAVDSGALGGWSALVQSTESLMMELVDIIEQWRNENSDYILEEDYETIQTTLGLRRDFFERLKQIDPPETVEERDLLLRMFDDWRKLHDELGRANRALADYIKSY